jgi:hypothetical protein
MNPATPLAMLALQTLLTWAAIILHAFFIALSGSIAKQQGHKFWQGMLAGLFLGPIAPIVLMIMQPRSDPRPLHQEPTQGPAV